MDINIHSLLQGSNNKANHNCAKAQLGEPINWQGLLTEYGGSYRTWDDPKAATPLKSFALTTAVKMCPASVSLPQSMEHLKTTKPLLIRAELQSLKEVQEKAEDFGWWPNDPPDSLLKVGNVNSQQARPWSLLHSVTAALMRMFLYNTCQARNIDLLKNFSKMTTYDSDGRVWEENITVAWLQNWQVIEQWLI